MSFSIPRVGTWFVTFYDHRFNCFPLYLDDHTPPASALTRQHIGSLVRSLMNTCSPRSIGSEKTTGQSQRECPLLSRRIIAANLGVGNLLGPMEAFQITSQL